VPEGDTIWRTARTLHAALAGRTVEAVEARGKHLLVRFGGGAVLHTHQGMRGRWRLLRSTESARAPLFHARAVIETAGVVAVCDLAPVVEMLSASQAAAHPALARLGPDLLRPGLDPAAARRRLRARAELPIGVALLDQQALAGIGNVYKSEVLFLCGVSPLEQVGNLDDGTIDRLVSTAAVLLRRNLGPDMRRTTSTLAPGRLWVYRRAGQPCRKCGTAVERTVQGEQSRATYFCPTCQGPVDS
jgi:endonuclease-8